MTWILTNDDIAQVLTVDDCLEVVEETFKDYALGKAANRPRSHSYAPLNTIRCSGTCSDCVKTPFMVRLGSPRTVVRHYISSFNPFALSFVKGLLKSFHTV